MADDRHFLPDQVWFDPANPEPLHDALRVDFVRVRTAAERRPSLRRHMESCATCAAIRVAPQSTLSDAVQYERRRLKLTLDHDRFRELLGLPAAIEIVHVYAENDPNVVTILMATDAPAE